MSDAKQRPDAVPQNQVDEEKGRIKKPQRTDDNTQVVDTSRGSETATRSASGHRG